MDIDDNSNSLFSLLIPRPTQWPAVLEYLRNNPKHLNDHEGLDSLTTIRRRLECDGAPLKVQLQLIAWYPEYLAFSLFLCATRFDAYSMTLMESIFKAIHNYCQMNMQYCIQKFHGDTNKEQNSDTVIGEAMTLLFSFFDDFIATPRSGNLAAIQMVRHKYPKSILYTDAHDFTPLHGVCCALNMDIFRYFIEWHLEEKPKGRGGLYDMNDSGITSLDTLIDTQSNILPALGWLRNRGLLKSKDVDDWLLIHRAAHSSSIETIRFFLGLLPSGVLLEDDDGNLPIHLHLGLRYRQKGTFPPQDLAITRLFISQGIINGGHDTIGGLFHPDPDGGDSCTLGVMLKEVGESNKPRVWAMIDECLTARGPYFNAPIVHAAILNKQYVPDELFGQILDRYGANSRNDHQELPLTYALRLGCCWDGCVSQLLKANLEALNEIDHRTALPLLPFAASRMNADLSTIYELTRMSLNLCVQY